MPLMVKNKITIDVAANERFPDIPDINVEDGYYLMGWNKTLPASGETTAGAMTFVAKYQVLTNGREYRSIMLIDNVQIATTKADSATWQYSETR